MPHGYFGPASATWQIYRESVFLFGSVRALLLQVAHPAVADGVARFSNFQQDALGRAVRTFLAMGTLYFGDKSQADSIGERLFRIHSGITGSYLTRQGDTTSVRHYTGNDPDLLLWVHATLVDTSLLIYEATMGALSPDLAEQFYQESKVAARVMHVPEDMIPSDLAAFRAYFQGVLTDGTLYVSDYGLATGHAIINHRLAPTRAVKYLAAGMLPTYLSHGWGIATHANSEARVFTMLRRFGRLYRLLPRRLRSAPAWHQAHYRVAVAEGKATTLLGRFWWSVAKRWPRLPLTIPVK